MNLQEIYNVAKVSVDYDAFKIRIAKIYNLCPTDATEIDKLNNLHLPQVSNLVCPTHGTMLYKHPNGLAYCTLCNYNINWQTGC